MGPFAHLPICPFVLKIEEIESVLERLVWRKTRASVCMCMACSLLELFWHGRLLSLPGKTDQIILRKLCQAKNQPKPIFLNSIWNDFPKICFCFNSSCNEIFIYTFQYETFDKLINFSDKIDRRKHLGQRVWASKARRNLKVSWNFCNCWILMMTKVSICTVTWRKMAGESANDNLNK